MDTKRTLIAAFAGLACGATAANGQSIGGRIVDESAAPIAGVLITAFDSTNAVAARVVTDDSGRFAIRPAVGRYRLTFEHIGFVAAERAVEIGTAGIATIELAMEVAPLALQPIVAESGRGCGRATDGNAARLWYLVRTAIGSAAAETHRRYRIRTYSRTLDTALRPTSADRAAVIETSSSHAFAATPIDSLRRYGYVRQDGDSVQFHAPDAEVLLSDHFVDSHCFHVSRDRGHEGLIGLAFTPRRGGPPNDIRGTMWIDERDGALSFVEFAFTGLEPGIDERFASGRVEFERFQDGGWMIARWYLRMPELVRARMPSGLMTERVLPGIPRTGNARVAVESVVEAGGEVQAVNMRPVGELTGSVIDTVPEAARARPGADDLIAHHCGASPFDEAAQMLRRPAAQLGLVAGVVMNAAGPIEGATIRAAWREYSTSPLSVNELEAWTRSTAGGTFAFCGLPLDETIELEILEGRAVAARERVGASRERVRYRELFVR